MEINFVFCPHCAAKGKPRGLRAATQRTPHVSRSDGRTFHLYLEESYVSRASGATREEVAALFRYDFDSVGQKSESTLVTIRPAAASGELVLRQLESCADRLAATLEKGAQLQKTYIWMVE
jgi:hypothetical protein